MLYRPSCAECSACLSARIECRRFRPDPQPARDAKAQRHLSAARHRPGRPRSNTTCFRDYLDGRHADGGMADMDVFEFAAMIEETPIRSRVIEYTREDDGTLNRRSA